MYYSLPNRWIVTLMLCSLCLQGCRPSSQVPSNEKKHEASDDESASSHAQSSQAPVIFGPQEWRQYFGEVSAAPSPPSDIDEILDSACPFWPKKRVKDTHLLVLIPATVDGKPFSLDLLLDWLIQCPKGGGHATRHRGYGFSAIPEQFGTQSPEKSYWVLMTRDVLESSRGKDYASQHSLVAQYAMHTDLPYRLPSVLEAATVVLSHYVRSGERLYANAPWTYTRCQELVALRDGDNPTVIGGFQPGGIGIGYNTVDGNGDYGVAGLREF